MPSGSWMTSFGECSIRVYSLIVGRLTVKDVYPGAAEYPRLVFRCT